MLFTILMAMMMLFRTKEVWVKNFEPGLAVLHIFGKPVWKFKTLVKAGLRNDICETKYLSVSWEGVWAELFTLTKSGGLKPKATSSVEGCLSPIVLTESEVMRWQATVAAQVRSLQTGSFMSLGVTDTLEGGVKPFLDRWYRLLWP